MSMIDLNDINETTTSRYRLPLAALCVLGGLALVALPIAWMYDGATETERMEARAAEHLSMTQKGLARELDDINAMLLLLSAETGEPLRVDAAAYLTKMAEIVSVSELSLLINADEIERKSTAIAREYKDAATAEMERLLRLAPDDARIFEPDPAHLAHPLGGVYREALALRFENAGHDAVAADIRALQHEQLGWRDIQQAATAMHPRAAGMDPERLEQAAMMHFNVDLSGAAEAARRTKIEALMLASGAVK